MRLSGKTTALVLLCSGLFAWATPERDIAFADGGSTQPSSIQGSAGTQPTSITPNEFEGSDVQRINRAIEVAAAEGKRVVIPSGNLKEDGTRSEVWLLDSAILLRDNTTLELDNCRIKLSDRCRDNFMRNVKRAGITSNIHIRGIGNAVLEGADHPRATGDSGKTLGKQSYGTDAGVAGASQIGDGRNFGIYLTSVEDFSLEGFTIKDSHSWAINLERCARGTLRNLGFASRGFKMIDGVRRNIPNQDGIDVRAGCHDILIENITGYTGDDPIALTSTDIAGRHTGDGRDIHHITLRNINVYSNCPIVLLLNNGSVKIHDILIDGVTDANPVNQKGELEWRPSESVVRIGSPVFGGIAPLGDTFNVTIRNVTSRARFAVLIAGSLSESTISNVVQHGATEPVTVQSGPEYVRNVTITDVRLIKN